MKSTKKFAIAGAGIGGLTLAIALQRKGFDVAVYEHAAVMKPVGAGLGLSGNAVKALMEIGIAEEVLRAGKIIKKVFIKDKRGNILVETDSEKISARMGVINNFTIHRADLHEILMAQLRPGTVIFNKGCIDFQQERTGVNIIFKDGTNVRADYLIGCDGIHSVIRKKLLPDSQPRYAGYTCWRAVTENIPASVNMEETCESWGSGSRFGIVPLSNNRLYWFACVNARANDPVMRSFEIPSLMVYFRDFHAPVKDILERTASEQLISGDIIDLRPLKNFAFGNIVLVGDAAHATTPNMGQGACMAIEDAATLANCLEHYGSPEEAFQQFEIKRIGRTTKIVKQSWTIGKMAQWENPLLAKLRNTLVRLTPTGVTEKQLKFISDVSFN
jgi:2-polyprenyl-6-methoxyphenol hydroxylase-like FAD-dependent oxidoreductase